MNIFIETGYSNYLYLEGADIATIDKLSRAVKVDQKFNSTTSLYEYHAADQSEVRITVAKKSEGVVPAERKYSEAEKSIIKAYSEYTGIAVEDITFEDAADWVVELANGMKVMQLEDGIPV